MCLFDIFARDNTHELCHQAVHHLLVIASLISISSRHDTKFDELWICHIVKGEDVSTSLFKCRAVCLEGIRINAWKQLSATMTKTLMKVSVNIVNIVRIFLSVFDFYLAPHEFLVEAIARCSSRICSRDVVDRNRL